MIDKQLTEALARVYQNHSHNCNPTPPEEIAYDFIRANFGDQIEPDVPKMSENLRKGLKVLEDILERETASYQAVPLEEIFTVTCCSICGKPSVVNIDIMRPVDPEDHNEPSYCNIFTIDHQKCIDGLEKSDKEVILEYMDISITKIRSALWAEGEGVSECLFRLRDGDNVTNFKTYEECMDEIAFDWNFLMPVFVKLAEESILNSVMLRSGDNIDDAIKFLANAIRWKLK